MLQKISDFIKSELQSMLKNRQQSQKFPDSHLDPAGGWRTQTSTLQAPPVAKCEPAALRSAGVNSNNFLATSRKTFSGAMQFTLQLFIMQRFILTLRIAYCQNKMSRGKLSRVQCRGVNCRG